MRKVIGGVVGAFVVLVAALAFGQSTMQPATNTPLVGCIEGRALRIVNGYPACATTSRPTLTACGSSPTLSGNATDFVGQIAWAGLLSACTLVLTKDYGSGFGCLVQSNSSASLVTTPTISSVSGKTQVAIPLSLTLSAGKVTYSCFPV